MALTSINKRKDSSKKEVTDELAEPVIAPGAITVPSDDSTAEAFQPVVVTTTEDGKTLPHLVIPREIATEVPCVGIRWMGETLSVAAPEEAWESAREKLSSLGIKYELIAATESDIQELLELVLHDVGGSNDPLEQFATLSGDAPVSQLVDELIERAIFHRASDLHLEPFEHTLRVRVRVDGRLKLLAEIPVSFAPAIASRIKVLSKLNIVERRRPQDGQFTNMIGDRRVDVRIATAATLYGEKIVLRIFDERKPLVSLTDLGMRDRQLEPFKNAVTSATGLILAAGPTGSGKTTTLHSALRAATSPTKNVTTIEDPVEYVVEGVNQIPVSDANGTSFAVQLRAILRQDPDVILVGETRDAETARISVQAALTGHLVLSSIHATDAVGALYRLMQMDIEPHLVASSLRCVISQRLVRRVCSFCREEYEPSMQEELILENHGLKAKKLARGAGCTFCGGSGYRDRVAAYQLLEISEHLAEAISNRPDPVEFRRMAMAEGMTTIAHEAFQLAVDGVTTVAEAMEFLESND